MNAALALALALLLNRELATAATSAAHLHHVPHVLLLAVGMTECALGARGGCVQAPGAAWPHRRATLAAQARAAAAALATGRALCGSWRGALRYYHRGNCTTVRCRGHRHRGPYEAVVLSLSRALARSLHEVSP